MFVCKNCGQAYTENPQKCLKCSGEVIETTGAAFVEPVEQVQKQSQTTVTATQQYAPVQTQTYNYQINTPSAPRLSGGTRAKGIVGLILGIEGTIGGAIFLLYSFIFMSLSDRLMYDSYTSYDSYGYEYSYNRVDEPFQFMLIWFAVISLIQMAAGIVGLLLSSKARNSGFVSKLTTSGKVLNILTIVFCAAAAIINIITANM